MLSSIRGPSLFEFESDLKEKTVRAFLALFDEAEVRAHVQSEDELFVNFHIVQYGAPVDATFVPGDEINRELRNVLLRALTSEFGQKVSGVLPTPPDKFHSGQLVAEVLVKRREAKQFTVEQVSGELEEAFEREIASRLKVLPATFSYDEVRTVVIDFETSVRESIARALSPHLNYHVALVPQDTYDEKRELAKWVNAELRRFGVAIKCPRTGLPAFLVADPGGRPGSGRFQLEVTQDGKPHRSVSSGTLMQLSLMASPVKPDVDPPARSHSR